MRSLSVSSSNQIVRFDFRRHFELWHIVAQLLASVLSDGAVKCSIETDRLQRLQMLKSAAIKKIDGIFTQQNVSLFFFMKSD